MTDKPRILIWDIENTPALGYFWGMPYKTDIIKIVESSRMMSFAAKWKGEPARSIVYRSTFHDGVDSMLESAYDLLDEADAVVSYNGKGHDTPHVNTEFMRVFGHEPSPSREIDLYKVVKGRHKFQANRLNFVSGELGIGQKLHTEPGLWFDCMSGNEKAWARFRRYNIQDVLLTEKLLNRLEPVIPPSLGINHRLWSPGACPKCGSTQGLERRGYAKTNVGMYPRFRCKARGCWSQGGRSEHRVEVRAA